MNDNEFGARVKPWLERSASGVGELQASRLKAARLRALGAMEPVRLFGLVTVTAGLADTIRYSVVQRALLWLPLAALLATLTFQSLREEPDPGAIDAQLLTQELPPDAYLDQDLRSWVGSQPQG